MNVLQRALCACTFSLLALAAAPASYADADFYQQRNLVSDSAAIPAANRDPNLVNAWGIAFNPYGFVWVADAGTGVSTLYDGDGKPQSLVVKIPPSASGGTANPTGIVYYGGPGFVVTNGTASGPSRFLFATESGVIAGWAPNVDLTNAIRMVDNSGATGAIYKGLALSASGQGPLLYATDFHNGRIDVFDSAFKPVTLPGTPFFDAHIPAGFAPFGIQAINGDIYVSYAKQDADKHDDVAGPGLGYISVFDPNGRLIRRLVARGALNAPWGMALAPASFGRFSNRLLVANFGDGTINAFDPASGRFVGRLKEADRRPVRIDGLWGIAFGNGLNNQPVDTLFFTAGPTDETHGLYGRLDVAPGDARDDRGDED
jgi:uncharacterized protein (TIGR03118 family)